MAKAITLIASALCIIAIAAISTANAHGEPQQIDIEGRVYCDTCRVEFETKLSRNIEGVTVSLICRDPISQEKKYETTSKTNSDGLYTIKTIGDHSDEICEVSIVDSPDESCNEVMEDLNKAGVDLAINEGIDIRQKFRYVNPLGLLAKEALVDCKAVLDVMGIVPNLD